MLDLHELLSFKNTCVAKASNMVGVVSDTQLKSLLQDDISSSGCHIQELKTLLENNMKGGM